MKVSHKQQLEATRSSVTTRQLIISVKKNGDYWLVICYAP